MIAHVLPVLAAAAGIGARALPGPQGVTALITPGPVPAACSLNYPANFGISVAAAGPAAPGE
jgi:hypothetical protein